MIPLRDQEVLRGRFLDEIKSRVRIDYFTQKPSKLYIPGREDCAHCEDVRVLVQELASLSPRIALTVHDLEDHREAAIVLGVDRVPAIVIRGQANRPVRFFGIPAGNEFPGLIETIIDAARGTPALMPETPKHLKRLKQDVHAQIFVTPTCPYCPALVRTAFKVALATARLKVDVVEATEFPALVQRHGVRAVPTTIFDDKVVVPGAMSETEFVQLVIRVAEGKPFTSGDISGGGASLLQQVAPQVARSPAAGNLILPR